MADAFNSTSAYELGHWWEGARHLMHGPWWYRIIKLPWRGSFGAYLYVGTLAPDQEAAWLQKPLCNDFQVSHFNVESSFSTQCKHSGEQKVRKISEQRSDSLEKVQPVGLPGSQGFSQAEQILKCSMQYRTFDCDVHLAIAAK